MSNLPRLTQFLRAFSDVSSEPSYNDNIRDELAQRRDYQLKIQPQNAITWDKIFEKIQKNTDKDDIDVKNILKDLHNDAREIGKFFPKYIFYP